MGMNRSVPFLLLMLMAMLLGGEVASTMHRANRRSEALTQLHAGRTARLVALEMGADLKVVNEKDPGAVVQISKQLVRGRKTVHLFTSRHCDVTKPAIEAVSAVACLKDDIAVRLFEIDRPDATHQDFDSPLAKQENIHVVPLLRIYGKDGRLIAEGTEAKHLIREWHAEEAGDSPGHNSIRDRFMNRGSMRRELERQRTQEPTMQ
jgi:hypothetical protein